MNFKRSHYSLILLTILIFLLAACDLSDDSFDDSFGDFSGAPRVYGENGHCYYVTDSAEVDDLKQAGLCPRSWVPVIMPILWEETYWDYYSSAAYYDHYIPARRRTTYRTVTIKKFYTTHKTEIIRHEHEHSTTHTTKRKTKTVTKKTTVRTRTTVRRR